jgi:hypothetical protein
VGVEVVYGNPLRLRLAVERVALATSALRDDNAGRSVVGGAPRAGLSGVNLTSYSGMQ